MNADQPRDASTRHRNDTLLPHDLEAEESLLGAMLLDGRATAAVIEICGATDFYQPRNGHIFGAIVALFDRDEPIDAVTVRDELIRSGLIEAIGDPAVLVSLQTNTPSIAHGPHYAKIVARLAKDRQRIALAREIAKAAYSGDADAAEAAARQVLDDVLTGRSGSGRFVDGATFVTEDATVEPIWGDGDDILMTKGEALLVCGPTGIGKTTLAQQLMLHRMGLRAGPLLGLSVAAEPDIVILYLAMDRPKQVARSLSRMVGPEDLDELRRRLVVWRGPPERDLAQHPDELLAMARRAHAGAVWVDSLKDAAVGLSDDEVGAGWNRAVQRVLAEGVDLVGLHHQRKAQPGNRPNSIDDVYGSTWITAGAGSVILLWGKPGDQIVELVHLKQPVAPVGPFKIEHDPRTGTSAVHQAFDLLETLNASPSGLTSTDAARLWFDVEHPDDNQRRRAKRALDDLVAKEPPLAHRSPGRKGGPGGTEAVRYYATIDREEPWVATTSATTAPFGRNQRRPQRPQRPRRRESAGGANNHGNRSQRQPEQRPPSPLSKRGVVPVDRPGDDLGDARSDIDPDRLDEMLERHPLDDSPPPKDEELEAWSAAEPYELLSAESG